jgi:uncharacterized membrane protein YgdD (TMEM256/DUF423 family)
MKHWLVLSCINGLLAVLLGAFGAHGLKSRLSSLPDGAARLEWWQTAAHYHLTHALALGLVAFLAGRVSGPLTNWAGGCFAAGILLFSGSLYVMTLTGVRALGAVTPLGGLLLCAGWAVAGWAALRM